MKNQKNSTYSTAGNKLRQRNYFDAWVRRTKYSKTESIYSEFFDLCKAGIKCSLLQLIADKPTYLILDAGSGDGYYSSLIAERKKCFIVDVDISPNSIKQAKQKMKLENIEERVEFIVSDAETLPLRSDKFDCVIAVGLLHHVGSLYPPNEFFRVMKEGGYLFLHEVVSDNPLRVLCERFLHLLPRHIRTNLLEVGPAGEIPEVHLFATNSLRNFLTLHFKIVREERERLFVFIPVYIIQLFPWVRYFIPNSVLCALLSIENFLIRILFFRRFCLFTRFLCIKN